jgi:uncharacterized coiled-coil protein SlyX
MSAIKEYFHDEIEAKMKPGTLPNKGNIDDIRCNLSFSEYSIEELNEEIEYEKNHKNRIALIRLLENKIKSLQRTNK